MIALLAWVTLLVVVRLGAVDGFFAPPSHCSARRPTPPTPPPHQRVASLSAAGLEWSKEGVPACYADAATLMTSALLVALAPQAGGRKLLSVDMLTPGLNPKLEQKALLSQEQLFDLVRSIIPALGESGRFRQVALMFPSMGDAAGYQKYAFQVKAPVPDWAVLTEVGVEYVPPDADCAVFITAKNNVGDPVISTIRDIVDAHPALTCVFLNCDLRDKVTTGIVARGARDAFRASIEPAFYFRNVVQVVRPTLVPIELGALTYTPRTQVAGCRDLFNVRGSCVRRGVCLLSPWVSARHV